MTILSKKKGNSAKNSGNNEGEGGVDGSHSHSHAHPHSMSHPHGIPQLQGENLNINSDRLYGNERSSTSQLWSQPHGHSQNLANLVNTSREEKRASHALAHTQSHPHHVEPSSLQPPHPLSHSHGKRRRRASPMRCSRPKHGRLERERPGESASPHSLSGGGSLSLPGSPGVNHSSAPESMNMPLHSQPVIGGPSSPEVTYNSEDEYESRPQAQLTEEEWAERERRFEKKMRKKGYVIKKMGEDGACLFRAVADQVYGDQDMHTVVRKHCMDYIAANGDYYSQYVTEDFTHYVSRKRLDHVHGNHIEIQAMSEMYNRTIEVFCYSTDPINIFNGTVRSDNEAIRLSYHRGVHYNSLVDPYKATIGVGLGLPGHIPGLADKNIVKEATRQNEDVLLEQAMLEDKLRATDWEATNEALEEQVARESYLQWLKDNERRNRSLRSPTTASSSTATSTSSCSAQTEIATRSPRHSRSGGSISPLSSPFRGDQSSGPGFRNSPNRFSPPPQTPGPSSDMGRCTSMVTSSPPRSPQNMGGNNHSGGITGANTGASDSSFPLDQLPPELFGMSDWEDAGLLAQVLAASQQEYLNQLKRNRENSSSSSGSRGRGVSPSPSTSSSSSSGNSYVSAMTDGSSSSTPALPK